MSESRETQYIGSRSIINEIHVNIVSEDLFEIFDGLQVTALGALRGITDVQRPMIYALVSYLFVAVPLAYIAGILLDFGAPGLLSGFCGGLMFAATLFIRRFNKSVKNIRLRRVTNL